MTGASSGAGHTAPGGAFPETLPALTSVRWFLALGVVLFHYQVDMQPAQDAIIGVLERARLGVDIFFVLSGFVLTHVYARQIAEGSYSHRRFLLARLARIYPAHIAMLAVMVAVVLGALALGDRFGQTGYRAGGLLSAALMTHSWFPVTYSNEWNGPSWSLSAEWAAYLAFPVFAFVGLKLRRHPWMLILLAVTAFLALNALYMALYGKTHAENKVGVLRIIPTFLLGVGLYHLGERLNPTRAQARWTAAGVVAGLLLLMQFQAPEAWVVWGGAAMVLALALLSKTGGDGVMAHPWLLAGGEASYALYLVHFPILIVWKNLNGVLSGAGSRYPLALWEAALLLVLTLAAAFVLHRFWERPARAWLQRRFLSRNPTPPLPSPSEGNPKP